MSNNKQSSVEWFLGELIKEGYIKRLPVTQLQQAKEMHRREHAATARDWWICSHRNRKTKPRVSCRIVQARQNNYLSHAQDC